MYIFIYMYIYTGTAAVGPGAARQWVRGEAPFFSCCLGVQHAALTLGKINSLGVQHAAPTLGTSPF